MELEDMNSWPVPGPTSDDFGGWKIQQQVVGTYVAAKMLLGLPGLEGIDPAMVQNKRLRRVGPGMKTSEGLEVGGFYVLADVASVWMFKHSKDARVWAANTTWVNKEIAPSLQYMHNGQATVRPPEPCCVLRDSVPDGA